MTKFLAAATMVVMAAASVHGSGLRNNGPRAQSLLQENMVAEDLLDAESFVSFETGAEDAKLKGKEDASIAEHAENTWDSFQSDNFAWSILLDVKHLFDVKQVFDVKHLFT